MFLPKEGKFPTCVRPLSCSILRKGTRNKHCKSIPFAGLYINDSISKHCPVSAQIRGVDRFLIGNSDGLHSRAISGTCVPDKSYYSRFIEELETTSRENYKWLPRYILNLPLPYPRSKHSHYEPSLKGPTKTMK